MDEKHNEMDKLILSCLEQKADKETYDRVWQWARQSPQNERHYRKMQDVFIASHLLDPIDNTQQERVWKQLMEKIKIRRKTTSNLRIITRWVAAAAFIVFVYLIGSQISGHMGSTGQHIITSDFNKQLFVVLNDGSKIWLNKDTRLSYSKDYGKKKREVYLTGEAYFEIAKDVSKPFVLKTRHMDINVLGTQFNVKAFDNDPETVTTLVEGSIRIQTSENEKIILQPGQQLCYETNSKKIKVHDVHSEQYTEWKNHQIVFNEELFENVLTRLEKEYNLVIHLQNEKLANRKITAKFDANEKPEKILSILQSSLSFKYFIENDTINIK